MPQLDVDIIHLKLQHEQEKRKVINKAEECQIYSLTWLCRGQLTCSTLNKDRLSTRQSPSNQTWGLLNRLYPSNLHSQGFLSPLSLCILTITPTLETQSERKGHCGNPDCGLSPSSPQSSGGLTRLNPNAATKKKKKSNYILSLTNSARERGTNTLCARSRAQAQIRS